MNYSESSILKEQQSWESIRSLGFVSSSEVRKIVDRKVEPLVQEIEALKL